MFMSLFVDVDSSLIDVNYEITLCQMRHNQFDLTNKIFIFEDKQTLQ